MGPTAGGPDLHIVNLKIENKILFVMISMVVLQIESTIKTLQYVYLGFLVRSRSSRYYFSNVKTKAVASDSEKINGAQCRQARRHS